MYPSSNNNASFFGNYYNNDNNHSKPPQDFYNSPSFSTFHLPSPIYIPFEDEAVFYEFFQQFVSNDHNHHNTLNLEVEMPNMESTMEEYSNNNDQMIVVNDGDDDHCHFNIDHVEPENSSGNKRLTKGDRHSKINTARGPRDRRMRLSLDVAKKLFGLQDLLGFDKASKTVDWLLTKSKTAILELIPDQSGSFMDVSNSASSTSECEVMSGTADHGFMVMTGDDDQATNKSKSSCGSSKKQKEKVARVRKCVDFHHPLAKASRERARERARERTFEKRNNNNQGSGRDSKFRPYCVDQAIMDQYANQLGPWSTLQENQHQRTSNWTPSHDFNYPRSSGLTHEHQFNELQINVKAWKGYNN